MKILRIGLFTLAVGCLVAGAVFAAAPDTIVYVTNTGDKYHRDTCRFVRNSKVEITLAVAIEDGYDACGVCKPPVLDEAE